MKLKLDQISFAYGKEQILKNFSLSVKTGEFVSLVGPSGSGKSTIFYLIGGLYQPLKGNIFLDGQVITGKRGHIGYMPQQPSLFPWRTVEENIRLGAELSSTSSENMDSLLKKVKLENWKKKYPHQLSGGMQQRVALIRTLVGDHSLLCLDEPFAALDALTRSNMQYWLRNLLKTEQRTVLLITHSIEEALLLSDRIVVFDQKPIQRSDEYIVPFRKKSWEEKRRDSSFYELRHEIEQLLQAKDEG